MGADFRAQAGLAAYFLGLPANAQRFAWSDERNKAIPWGLRLKQYMTALSYQWTDGPAGILRPEFVGILPFNAPSEVNMVYNGAFGPMNGEFIQTRDQDSCQLED